MKLQLGGRRSAPAPAAVMVAALLALAALRLIHLEADAPEGLDLEGSVGTYVDEGYKTLEPRNLALFGSIRWHPDDQFRGWMEPRLEYSRHHWSPLTQWPLYLAFEAFGPRLGSARGVSFALFLLLLVGYVYAVARDFSRPLFFSGLALLSLHTGLFFYSRAALFVMPVAVCVYWLLFLLRRLDPGAGQYRAPALILAFAVVSTFGVRAAAPLYLAPIILGWLAARWLADGQRWGIGYGLGILGFLALLAFLTRAIWWGHLDFSELLAQTFLGPSLVTSTLWVVAGLLCAAHVVVTDPRRFLASPYRAALVAMVTVGPLMLGLFAYNPPRYAAPFLPAYALLILEWLHLRAWRYQVPPRLPWTTGVVSLGLSTWAIFSLAHGFNLAVLREVPIVLGSGPGLSDDFMFPGVALFAVVPAWGLWHFRHRLLAGGRMAALLTGLLLFSTLLDIYELERFFAAPSYRSREISAEIRRIVPPGEIVGGDWAPYFGLGTDLKVLHMNLVTNRPTVLGPPRPDFFLFCDSYENRRLLKLRFKGAELEPPVLVSSYLGREVRLHPLKYLDEAVSLPE